MNIETLGGVSLNDLHLDKGSHSRRSAGVCLLEAAAWLAGEAHSANPKCVSPVLTDYGIALNDRLPDGRRQELVPLLPRLLGTSGDGLDEARSYMALDWLIRTYTPAWLDLAGLTAEATALRDLRRIADLVAAQAAGPVVRQARASAGAARAAAGAAFLDSVRATEAGDVGWAAVRAAGWAVVGGAAAADTARVAAGAAWAADAALTAAGVNARAVLGATVERLQTSAIVLFDAMIAPGATS